MEQLDLEETKMIIETLIVFVLCIGAYYWIWRPKEKKQEKKFDKNYHKIFGQITKKLKEKE